MQGFPGHVISPSSIHRALPKPSLSGTVRDSLLHDARSERGFLLFSTLCNACVTPRKNLAAQRRAQPHVWKLLFAVLNPKAAHLHPSFAAGGGGSTASESGMVAEWPVHRF